MRYHRAAKLAAGAFALAVVACQPGVVSVEEAKKITAGLPGEGFIPPPRTIEDITAILDQQKPDAALAEANRKAADAALPVGALRAGDGSRRQFVGFGDPWFNREEATEAQRDQTTPVAASLDTRGVHLRAAPATENMKSADLQVLPRLPDTAEEVREVAAALKADPQHDVFLGAAANEGRAFFYAGARALLVTNWSVETISARLLTTGTFRHQAADPSLTSRRGAAAGRARPHHRARLRRCAGAHGVLLCPSDLLGALQPRR